MTPKTNDLLPSIDTIREVSPDRCIIADIFAYNQSAKDFAQKGVAVSYRLAMTDTDVLDHKELYKWNMTTMSNEFKGSSVIEGFTWPYDDHDANALFAKKRWVRKVLIRLWPLLKKTVWVSCSVTSV